MFCANKKCSPSSAILFLVIAGFVLWLLWFGVAFFLGKIEAEKGIALLSQRLTEIGAKNGKDVKMTYGNVTVEGWGSNTRAVVRDVLVESVKMSSSRDYPKLKVKTDEVVIHFDPFNLTNITAKFHKPIAVSQGIMGKRFSFPEPLVYSYKLSQNGGVLSNEHSLDIPQTVILGEMSAMEMMGLEDNSAKDEQAKPVESKEQENKEDDSDMKLSFSKKPTLSYVDIPAQQLATLTYEFNDIILEQESKRMLMIGKLSGNQKESAGDDEGKIAVKTVVSATGIVTADLQAGYDFNFDTDETIDTNSIEEKPLQTVDPKIADNAKNNLGTDRNIDSVLNDLSFSGKDFSIKAKGKVFHRKGEKLPFGEADFNIQNVKQFLSSELMNEIPMESVRSSLSKITGKKVDEEENISFPVKRAKGGMLLVGEVAFEELMASFLPSMILPMKPDAIRPDGSIGDVERLPDITILPTAPEIPKQ